MKLTALLSQIGLDRRDKRWAALLLLGLGVALFFAVLYQNPDAVDWHFTYRPAALAMIAGKSPFAEVKLFFTSPWALIPLIPFALLPESVGRALFFVVSVGMFAVICYRLGGKPIAMLAFLLSPPVVNCIQTGNIEWLMLLGFILPPQIGLIFLAIKPQSAAAAGLFYLIEAWREGGVRQVFKVAWPVTLVIGLSLLAYGLWPLKAQAIFDPAGVFNISLWPKGIPIGAVLLVMAIRQRKKEYAMMAGPFLSPYTILISWTSSIAGLSASTVEMVVASLAMWVFWAIFRLSI